MLLAIRLRQLKLREQFLLLFLLGLTVRVLLILLTHEYRDLSRYELQRAAYSLATTGVLGNPYAIPTGPTAHVSPGYPILLAAIYRLFGAGSEGEVAKELLACAVAALGWACLPWVGAALRLPFATGLLAGLAGALLPVKLSVETKGDWEAPYTALALILITVVTMRIWNRAAFSLRDALASGLLWGISLLFAAALLPALAVLACIDLARAPSWKFGVVRVAVVAVILSPWIVRNSLALGAPVATRTNFGLELRLSNNDVAGPLERDNFERGVYHVYHPLQSVREAEQVRRMGEVAFNRAAQAQAVQWIRQHPGRFASLTAQRIFFYWFQPVPHQALKTLWLALTALGGFVGLTLLARERPSAALLPALFLLLVPLPNYLVHVGLRHRYSVDWLCLLLAVYALQRGYAMIRFTPH